MRDLPHDKSPPLDGAAAFLDVLLRRPTVTIKHQRPFGGTRQVDDDEVDAGYNSPVCQSTLVTTRRPCLLDAALPVLPEDLIRSIK